MRREVFVTGVGLVTPAGCGTEATWHALVRGERAVAPLVGLDLAGCATTFGGQIAGFLPPPGTGALDRVCQLAVAAADEALAAAGLDFARRGEFDAPAARVSFGTSKGGILSFTAFCHKFLQAPKGSFKCYFPNDTYSSISHQFPYTPFHSEGFYTALGDVPPDAPARHLAARYGIEGGIHVPVAACATGALAVVRGARLIQDGDAELVLCGGADASLHPLWIAAFEQMGVLAPAHPVLGPGWACRPFDRTRGGFALGEGAAALVFESGGSVRRRKARPIARICGVAAGTDPAGLTQLTADARPLAHVIRRACAEARVASEGIACVHAHGTATTSNDLVETQALRGALGPAVEDIPIVSAKGAIGHLLGAAGAVGRLSLPQRSFRPRFGVVLKTALGFGGHLGAVVVGPA